MPNSHDPSRVENTVVAIEILGFRIETHLTLEAMEELPQAIEGNPREVMNFLQKFGFPVEGGVSITPPDDYVYQTPSEVAILKGLLGGIDGE